MENKESLKRKVESEAQGYKAPSKKIKQNTWKPENQMVTIKIQEEKKEDTLKDHLKPAEPWLVKEEYPMTKANDDDKFKEWCLSAKDITKKKLIAVTTKPRRENGYSRTEVDSVFYKIISELLEKKGWDGSKTIFVDPYCGINLDCWKKGGDELESKFDFLRS